jgi:magnesium-transporting ATPase (P-type)
VLLLCKGEKMPRDGEMGALCLVGGVCFCDPVRADAPRAVRTLQQAGVQVVMLTGDSRETAGAVASACGILREGGVNHLIHIGYVCCWTYPTSVIHTKTKHKEIGVMHTDIRKSVVFRRAPHIIQKAHR